MLVKIEHNGFHGQTQVALRIAGEGGQEVPLTRGQMKRLDRAVCGVADCACGESMYYSMSTNTLGQVGLLTLPKNRTIKIRGRYPQDS